MDSRALGAAGDGDSAPVRNSARARRGRAPRRKWTASWRISSASRPFWPPAPPDWPAVYSGRAMATLTSTRKSSLRRELETIVGPGGVLSEPDELLVYESDGLTLFRALADFIVFPTSAEQVAGVVRLANRESIPFVARGAG